MSVISPLTGSSNVVFEKNIRCDWLIANYQQQLGIDVSKYFAGLESIQIYKCLDTGYRFYYPFNVDGDGAFYEALQKFDWYYMDWKWEHQITSEMIKPTDKVLEIGCARGGFLNRVKEMGAESVGLELNRSAAEAARARGLNVFDQSIQDHARENPEKYDMVCSFQVVEHIAAIKPFLQASVDALRCGGKLIFSVPHNYSDSPLLQNNILDMPPHHSGLWDSVALANLQNLFALRLEMLLWEPVQKSHRGIYHGIVRDNFENKLGLRGRFANTWMAWIQQRTIQYLSEYLLGHTIIAHYRKLP